MARIFQIHRFTIAAVAGLIAASATAGALPPGSSTATTGTSTATAPNLAGTIILDEITPFSFASAAGTVSGVIEQRVIRSVDSTLDFYWQIMNDATSAARLNQFDIFNFISDPSSLLLADYRSDTVGSAASDFATRSPGFGGEIGFHLDNGVGVSQSSRWLMLDSKEHEMAKIGKWQLAAIGGGSSDAFATYVPGAAVPEPSSWALLAAGLSLVSWTARRREPAAL